MTTENAESPKKGFEWKSWAIFAAVGLALYFGNVELQTYLGKQALAKTGFEQISFDDALAKAATTNKLVLADMSAIWCSSCRKLDNEVFSNPAVQKAINDKFVFVRIEYESEAGEAFMERYKVSGFPTVLILDAGGKMLRRVNPTFNPREFISNIQI